MRSEKCSAGRLIETTGICLASMTPRMRIRVVDDCDESEGDNAEDVQDDVEVLVVMLRVWMMMLSMSMMI